jgi:hypothetical protein
VAVDDAGPDSSQPSLLDLGPAKPPREVEENPLASET